MKRPFQRVLLHVGPPKTGSTSIQNFLVSNRNILLTRGFYVPLASSLGAHQLKLPLLFGPHHRYQERLVGIRTGPIDAQRESVANAFATEMANAIGGHTLLISSEHLFAANPAAIEAYRKFFAPYAEQFESLMYLRRQDRWMVSRVLQSRKVGARSDTRLGPGAIGAFEKAVRIWAAGSDRCHIRRFEDEFLFRGSLLEDFCDRIGLDDADLDTEVVRNRAILQEQLELSDALNVALAMAPNKKIAYHGPFLLLCTEVLGGARFEFSRETALATFAAYAQVNTWLRKTRDPEGPRQFFNTDFDEYPTEPANGRLYSTDQLLQLAAFIDETLGKHGLDAAATGAVATRPSLVTHIVTSFMRLHDYEHKLARTARRAAVE